MVEVERFLGISLIWEFFGGIIKPCECEDRWDVTGFASFCPPVRGLVEARVAIDHAFDVDFTEDASGISWIIFGGFFENAQALGAFRLFIRTEINEGESVSCILLSRFACLVVIFECFFPRCFESSTVFVSEAHQKKCVAIAFFGKRFGDINRFDVAAFIVSCQCGFHGAFDRAGSNSLLTFGIEADRRVGGGQHGERGQRA